MRAFQTCRAWLASGMKPETLADLPAVTAASATLRFSGQIVGRGVAIAKDADDRQAIQRAIESAWSQARERLPIERDVLWEEHAKQAASILTLSLELAGPLTPVSIERFEDAVAKLAPGLDGIGVRIGDRTGATFPEALMLQGGEAVLPWKGLVSRVAEDDALGLKEPKVLTREHGVVFYRFRTTHLIQPKPGDEPVFLSRGGRLVPAPDLASLTDTAHRLAASLLRRRTMADDQARLSSLWRPARPDQGVVLANPAEAAATVMALRRYSRMPGASTATAASADSLVNEITKGWLGVQPPELDPASKPEWAAAVITAMYMGTPQPPQFSDDERALIARCATRLEQSLSRDGSTVTFKPDVPPASQALIALACACRAREEASWKSLADQTLAAVYRSNQPGQLPGQMPWLIWAEQAMHASNDLPASSGLREVRRMVWTHQLKRDDLPPDQFDFAGGLVLTASATPMPTWHTARITTGLGAMLGDERLTTPRDFPGELMKLLAAHRFLRQLVLDEYSGALLPLSETYEGSTRISLWDYSMPIDATSLSLLSFVEIVEGINKQAIQAAKPKAQ